MGWEQAPERLPAGGRCRRPAAPARVPARRRPPGPRSGRRPPRPRRRLLPSRSSVPAARNDTPVSPAMDRATSSARCVQRPPRPGCARQLDARLAVADQDARASHRRRVPRRPARRRPAASAATGASTFAGQQAGQQAARLDQRARLGRHPPRAGQDLVVRSPPAGGRRAWGSRARSPAAPRGRCARAAGHDRAPRAPGHPRSPGRRRSGSGRARTAPRRWWRDRRPPRPTAPAPGSAPARQRRKLAALDRRQMLADGVQLEDAGAGACGHGRVQRRLSSRRQPGGGRAASAEPPPDSSTSNRVGRAQACAQWRWQLGRPLAGRRRAAGGRPAGGRTGRRATGSDAVDTGDARRSRD